MLEKDAFCGIYSLLLEMTNALISNSEQDGSNDGYGSQQEHGSAE